MAHGGGQEILIKDAIVFLFAFGVFVPLFRIARLPSVVGFLLAGAALGPYGLARLAEEFHFLEYISISEPAAAAPFAELGVLTLLFLLGLEMSFGKLWALRRVVFGAGSLQAGLSAVVIAMVALAFGAPGPTAAVIGLALALSSTAIVMQMLIEQRRGGSPVGRTALGILLFQDLMVAPILIFTGFAGQADQGGLAGIIFDALWQGLVAVVIILFIGRFVLRRVFSLAAQGGGRDFLMALTLLTVVGAAAITASAGLSLALGAFLAGLLLGETEFKHQTEVDLEPFKGLLLGLFFMTVGMSLDITVIAEQWGFVLGGVVALIVGKAIIATLACRLFAGGMALSLESAFLLSSAGEFAFVVVAAATAAGVLGPEAAALVTAIAGLTMMLIPALSWAGKQAAARFDKPETPEGANLEDYADLTGHVIVAGFGRVGRTIADVLGTEDTTLIALDRSTANVLRARKNGWHVYLGDAAREEILVKAGAHGASLFVVTIDDAQSAEAMVRAVRAVNREAPILARAQDAEHAQSLYDAGAHFVIPDAVEAGLQMAARALEEFGYDTDAARGRIAAERDAQYRKRTE